MFAAVAGLRSHQTMMDVVGNNIANINTVGYKTSGVTFQEALSQTMRGAGSGINPMQVGLGARLASIDPVFTQGGTQTTGRATDVAIQGDGFFIVQNGDERLYTRAGKLDVDANGTLVGSGGYQVLGWTPDATGKVDYTRPVSTISVPVGQVAKPAATTAVTVAGNLSADAAVGDSISKSIVVYDSLGQDHEVALEFTKTAANTWGVTAGVNGTNYTLTPSTLTFAADGTLSSTNPIVFSGFTPSGADPMSFDIDFGGQSPLVQFGGASSAEAFRKDGRPIGVLRGFSIADDGSITGQFSNGETMTLGAIATASFANPSGLVRTGNSNYSSTVNSGEALIGQPGTGSRGSLSAGALEMSNVDLAQEFTNLIIAQRGFQANSRVVTASDELLSDLVNLKR
ncbi:MAG TPA: flagellar hook protein FlgE [Actinomycetota bacterium]